MVALIEYDYLKTMASSKEGSYPIFLTKMLKDDYEDEDKDALPDASNANG